jgi:ADP-ribose pyrophosphatase YjhB (NUDIX family)/phosphoglycolate phosphatase-like HAD superfamily hydrolase
VIRNIIFDWSGTLVNDLPAVWQATNHVFRQAGVPEISLDQFRAEFVLPFKGFYDRHVPHVAMPQLEEWFHSRFNEVQHTVEELPHARDFLTYCRAQNIRTFLLSTIHATHFAEQTKKNGFHDFLDHPYVGVWDKRTRIREIIAEHGLRLEETIFIGDMQHDVETARHGGIWSCAVLTGFNRLGQLRESRPDLIVEHLGELKDLMERRALSLPVAGEAPVKRMPICTVGAVIFNERNEVLLVRTHKWSDMWGIPGGKIKWGETSEDALRRELKEETNLDVTDVQFVMVQDCIHSEEFYRDAHFVLLNYTCRCAGGQDVRLNEEAEEFRWFSLAEAKKQLVNQPTKLLLENIRTF